MALHRRCSFYTSTTFLKSFIVGILAGCLACLLRYLDVDRGYDFIVRYNPDTVVFNVFVVFASLVAAFRTAHALERYVGAAALMHKQTSSMYETAATLFNFCKVSEATPEQIKKFQHIIVRLFSLLSALCLERLEFKSDDQAYGHTFEVIGWDDLDEALQHKIMSAPATVEYVFQAIERLMVDSVKSKLVTIAPPIMNRTFTELGKALSQYHEAKKFAGVPLPYAYLVINRMILSAEAVFVPFIMAAYTQGYASAYIFTFGGTFMLWFLNSVAENLDNPFAKEANTLEVAKVQDELNVKLHQLLMTADEPKAAMSANFMISTAVSKRSVIDMKRDHIA